MRQQLCKAKRLRFVLSYTALHRVIGAVSLFVMRDKRQRYIIARGTLHTIRPIIIIIIIIATFWEKVCVMPNVIINSLNLQVRHRSCGVAGWVIVWYVKPIPHRTPKAQQFYQSK